MNNDHVKNELEEGLKTLDYLLTNMDKLPALLQLQLIKAFLDFVEKLKPIYVQVLMILGYKED